MAILTLIKLQFKAGFSSDRASSMPKALKAFIYAVLALAGVFVVVMIYGTVTRQFTQPFQSDEGVYYLNRPYLTYTILGFHLLQTLFLLPLLLKNLDINNERETLLRLPVTRTQIFVSKIIVSYLYEVIFTAAIMVPILISFGIFSDAPTSFWIMAPFTLLFLPFFPFFISALLLFPVMMVVRFLKTRSILTFITYMVIVGILFYAYMQLLTNIAMMIIYSKGMRQLLQDASPKIIATAKIFVFQDFFAQVFVGDLLKRIVYLVACGAISTTFAILGIFILNGIFNYSFKSDFRKKFSIKRGQRKLTDQQLAKKKPRPRLLAITIRELKNIFRSSNYSFQFFMIIMLIPFFVFFCTNIASYTTLLSFRNEGEATVALDYAQRTIFGIALFVSAVMVPLANSFAATNISREAGNIYHTKVIPISYRKQLMIKFFICLIPTLASLFVSSFLLLIPVQYPQLNGVANPVLTINESLLLFLITSLLSVGFISIGTLLDLKRPLCSAIGNAAGGELTSATRQVNIIIVVGFILGAIIGFMVLFSNSLTPLIGINLKLLYTIVSGFLAVLGFSLLFLLGGRTYRLLEQ